MTCYHPLTMYWTGSYTANGKKQYTFNSSQGYIDMPQQIPCGQCIGCRLRRSRDWSVRCMCEARMHDKNCFITLTYNNENLPENGTLIKKHVQDFFKRLRKNLNIKVRYYMCGEYGTQKSRPHYHICLFGYDFPDKKLWKVNNGYPLYNSDILTKLWPYGYSVIGSLTYESTAYVARYILKKQLGKDAKIYDELGIIPEYTTMSRRPGIGGNWFDMYHSDVFANDFKVMFKNVKVAMPLYYEKMFDIYYPDYYNLYKRYLRAKAKQNKLDSDDFRRLEACKYRQIKRLVRPVESEGFT